MADQLNLTDREREVCLLVAELKSVSTIAFELGLSVKTVESYMYAAARMIPGRGPPMKRIIRHFGTPEGESPG